MLNQYSKKENCDTFGNYSEVLSILQNILERIKKDLLLQKESENTNFKLWQGKNQNLIHGLAWIATYIESLMQLKNWAIELHKTDKISELEYLILDIAFEEYLKQILNGIPMSQTEFIKITDYKSISEEEALKLRLNFEKKLNFTNINEKKERIVELAINKENITTFENTALEQEFELIREQFRKFNSLNINSEANDWHLRDQLIPKKIITELAKMGVFGLTIPEEYGGLGLNKLAMCVVSEELARGYIGVGSLATRTEIASELILNDGTNFQKKLWLSKISSGECIPAACFTEPDTGSDLGSITTKAKRKKNKYLISGNKTWITHGSRSNLLIILARTNNDYKLKHKGLSIFLASKKEGSKNNLFPDESISGTEIKVLGYRGMKEFEIRLENLEVKDNGLLGEIENKGFSQLMRTFESARIQTAARSIGVAQNALDLAMSYSSNRKQFDKPIINFQRVFNKLAIMMVEIVIGRQLTYFAAKNKDLGYRCDLEAGMAKLLCARIAWSCADNALQIHGGNGYALEYEISRVLCDARVLNIFEGSAEIQAQIISNRILEKI